MRNIYFIVGVCLLFAGSSFAQDPVQTVGSSESKTYTPVVFPGREKKKDENSAPSARKGGAKAVSLTIPVSVYEKTGVPVGNLKKGDFSVFVDGAQIQDFEVQDESEPLNIYLLIDTSPSTSYKIERLRNFAEAFLESVKPTDRFWLANFDEKLELRSSPPDTREQVLKKIGKLKLGNGTSLYDSIERLLESGFKDIPGNKAVVIVTDGVDTISENSNFEASLVKVESSDIAFYPVYMNTESQVSTNLRRMPRDIVIGRSPIPGTAVPRRPTPGTTAAEYALGRIYLDSVVRITGGRAFEYDVVAVSNETLKQMVVTGIRPDYRITFKLDEAVQQEKRLGIKVRVNRPDLVVTSRGSYIKN